MQRIFADFNNADERGRIRLNTRGALEDIRKSKIDLKPGLRLILEDREELETEGVICFSEEEKIWVVEIDWSSLGI